MAKESRTESVSQKAMLASVSGYREDCQPARSLGERRGDHSATKQRHENGGEQYPRGCRAERELEKVHGPSPKR